MFLFKNCLGSGDEAHWKSTGDAGVRNIDECKNTVQNRKLLQVGRGVTFCLRQAASQWACNMSPGLELAGGQLRGPDKKQTLGKIFGMGRRHREGF